MRKKSLSVILCSAALALLLLLCPRKTEAATVIYIRKGVTGSITYNSAPVPNASWKVKKKSVLKLKSSTSTKAVYYGKKVGKTTLTCYNKRVPSQKMDITVYVMPSGKLNKMDFQLYGSDLSSLGAAQGANWIDSSASMKTRSARIPYRTEVTASNAGNFFQTTRTAQLLDPWSRIKMLYGKTSIKKFKKTDRYYKYSVKTVGASAKSFFKKYIKYYADYKYGKKYRIRFYFNSKKKVTLICYFKNYSKI